jgi:hypothetical protein
MWKDKFETDRLAEAFANDVEKKFNPTHKPREEAFTLGMNLVDEKIERLLMPLDQVNEYLDSSLRILLADWQSKFVSRTNAP